MDIIVAKKAAEKFAKDWADRGDEKQDTQNYWNQLLRTVFDVEVPEQYIQYEKPVAKGFIDGYIADTKVLIEQKGMKFDLDAKEPRQGKMVTPYEQARDYVSQLAVQEKPNFIVTCNFQTIRIYDCRIQPQYDRKTDTWHAPYEEIELKDLPTEFRRLGFLANVRDRNIKKEMEVSIQAGDLVGLIYDKLLSQYQDPDSEETQKSLNMLCVRLVFCFYAEDAEIFSERSTSVFHDYLKAHRNDARTALLKLFKILDTKIEDRDPYEDEDLLAFPYVNGGLFSNENIIIPRLTPEIVDLILEKASADFDWSGISPTIFGAVFESTLNPETRRAGGMHYTSIENIHKVIDPLFLDDLKMEFEQIKNDPVERGKVRRFQEFQNKLASLKFLDPAAGSGNFLTESYLSLRRLENQVIGEIFGPQMMLVSPDAGKNPIKVSINQFYGIEINDFAVTVARTAMWIAESQMMKETELMMFTHLDFLPLKQFDQIWEGNALRKDWNEVVPANELNYIMGNPPFVGRRYRTSEQQKEVALFYKYKDVDYVACWYAIASDYMKNTVIKAAFVSTNSICQGEQVAPIWGMMFDKGIVINFAYRTFIWDSEASLKAHVYCVIVGFSYTDNNNKYIYEVGKTISANNINGYLLDAPNVILTNRSTPLCSVPKMQNGNVPLDGDALKIEASDYPAFADCKFVKKLIGGSEMLYNRDRYVLWLVNASPADIKADKRILERVEMCRANRLAMKDKSSQKLAERPTTFRDTNNPEHFIAMPIVSGERRRYIPMAYYNGDTIPTNQVQIVPDATLYHLGVLTSNVHMGWMRAVCGRLKGDYRYSKDVVYNNFPWPNPTPEQKAKIEETAQAILDARAKYPDSSLADLYDPLTMPPDLLKAHQNNDRAVMAAYGIKKGDPEYSSESACVAMLMKMCQKLVEGEK
ncbi:MAG: class I SAM-dependent DNA methyltransferase [Eubacterium sp.]|nr:class I SAM-dependent DNA methyltransferase [Eubacterium sp.]